MSKEDIKNKFVAVQELQGQKVPTNFIEIISEKIDRAIEYLDNLQKNNDTLYVSLIVPELTIALAKTFLKAFKIAFKTTNNFAKAFKKAIEEAKKLLPNKEEQQAFEQTAKDAFKKVDNIASISANEKFVKDLDMAISEVRAKKIVENKINDLQKSKNLDDVINFMRYIGDPLKNGGFVVGNNSKELFDYVKSKNLISKKDLKRFKVTGNVNFTIYFDGKKLRELVPKSNPKTMTGKNGNFAKNPIKFTEYIKENLDDFDNQAEYNKKIVLDEITKLTFKDFKEDAKNLLQLWGSSTASDTPLRMMGKLRSYQKEVKEVTYEHTPPIATLRQQLEKIIDNYKQGDSTLEFTNAVKKILDKSFVDLVQSRQKGKDLIPKTGNTVDRYDNILDVNKDLEYFRESRPAEKDATLSEDFNEIIENKTGIAADKVYKKAKAEVVGASKGKWKFFIPPGAEDFVGLLYATLGKDKLGDQQMAWYKYNLLNPYTDALNNITRDRVQLAKNFKELKKQLKIVPKNLRKKIPGTQYSQQDAVRVYIWNKQGVDMLTEENGMDKADLDQLVEFVEKDSNLLKFADQLMEITQQEYAEPGAKWWNSGTIDADLLKTLSTTRRAKYLEQSGWTENVNAIFSKENLNKLEAAYGKPYRIALENILKRMKSGRNRSFGGDALTSRFTDWISNSIGTIMFLNSRSAVLQTISAVNFINWSDNNILAVAKTFANPKQWAKDFMMLMNSPFLIERRNGLKIDVNESEIADLAKTSTNKAKAIMGQLLKAGFLPTQIADSFAIASGGASFYRNRFNSLVKEGYTKEEAEVIAMRDFRETATESQQSSDPSRISQQQAGPLGRIVLAFANTPAQYARLTKKAVLDIKNGRGDLKTNVSKIIYYMVVQNIIFTALQQALFAVAFGDEEEEDEMNKKYIRMANSMSDSILRGLGFAGAAVSVAKNVAIKIAQESDKKSPKFEEAAWKLLEISPPISSKISKFRSAGRQISWNRKEIQEKGLSLENPAAMAGAQIIAGATNLPVDRALRKIDNVQNALSEDAEMWQRVALLSGWQDWEIGMKQTKKSKTPLRKNIKTIKRKTINRKTIKRKTATRKIAN